MFRETNTRSIAKAISWRVLGTLVTAALVFVLTRRMPLSLTVGGLEFIAKIGLFWLHERAWDRLAFGKMQLKPNVVWFTGLSGAGKSTIADWIAAELRQRGLSVERLDGDSIRNLFPSTGFTRPERDAHIRRIGFLASKLEQHGVFVVASFVSPYEESRKFVRGLCQSFTEVYVATPIEECERRDVKGLYVRARRGEILNLTGVNDPYEVPIKPDVVLDASRQTIEEAGRAVLRHLNRRLRGRL